MKYIKEYKDSSYSYEELSINQAVMFSHKKAVLFNEDDKLILFSFLKKNGVSDYMAWNETIDFSCGYIKYVIRKYDDEWYMVQYKDRSKNSDKVYFKCDQLQGVMDCILFTKVNT